MNSRQAFGKLLLALDARLPDTELDLKTSTERQVKKRCRVVSVTALAMIEESGAQEMARHNEGTEQGRCSCGFRYSEKLPQPMAHAEHIDKVLTDITLSVVKAVKKSPKINWTDVKLEADSWDQIQRFFSRREDLLQ